MRILQVLTGKLSYDGISTVALNILRYMSKCGTQVDLVAQADSDENLIQEVKSLGVDITIIHGRLKSPLQYIGNLREVLKKVQYDIIHIHGNSATVSLELAATKQCSSITKIVHSHNTTCKYKLLDQLLRRYMYQHTDLFLACGSEAGKWLCGKQKFDVIRNGIDVKKYLYSDGVRKQIRAELEYNDNAIVLGHVGVFNDQKNQLFLLDILSQLIQKHSREYKMLLIGQGSLLEQAKNKAKDLKIEDNVIFYGTTDKIHKMLSAMDIFVMPSLYEGLPLSLVEAQASGLPILASNTITQEVNLTGNVEFYELKNQASDWADRIERLCVQDRNASKQVVLQKISNAGYDIESEMQKLHSIYEKISKKG